MHYIFKFLQWAVEQLPEWDPGHSDSIQGLFNLITGINDFFPLEEIAECCGLILAFHGLLIIWRPLLKFIRVA